jgi:LPS O-antigen subunit length determinant protein (WzzB/FepE family)
VAAPVARAGSSRRRRAWLIVIATFVGCVLSLQFALCQTKIYEATAVVKIEDARVAAQLAGTSVTQTDDASHQVRLIEQRLMARDNLMRVMEKHDLFSADPALSMNERVFQMREAARIEEILNGNNQYAPGAKMPAGMRMTVRLADSQKAPDVANELRTPARIIATLSLATAV